MRVKRRACGGIQTSSEERNVMKKIFLILLTLTLLVTPHAQAKTCFGISCNYIDTNYGFQSSPAYTDWNVSGVSFVTETSCYSTIVAEIGATDSVSRSFYVDNTYSAFTLQFRLFLPTDPNSAYDQLVVTVTNNDTSVSESFYYNGNTYNTQCGQRVLNLANDYSNSDVTVTFYGSGLTAHPWQIDDVGFFAYY
jgi:hypothetical protein